jgi:uncharacterized membrane protein
MQIAHLLQRSKGQRLNLLGLRRRSQNDLIADLGAALVRSAATADT